MSLPSVFDDIDAAVYRHRWRCRIVVGTIAGGTPTDPRVAERWLRTKLEEKDDILREEVAKIMLERGVDQDTAASQVVVNKHLNGFRRDDTGLFMEGRHVKAAMKEAACVRWPSERWGPTRKGTKSFWAEHVFVLEDRLHITRFGQPVQFADGVAQRFVHTFRGNGIQYEEYVSNAELSFTVATDEDFTRTQWGELWVTGQRQGVGASRSQGFGTYTVVEWEPLALPVKTRRKAAAK